LIVSGQSLGQQQDLGQEKQPPNAEDSRSEQPTAFADAHLVEVDTETAILHIRFSGGPLDPATVVADNFVIVRLRGDKKFSLRSDVHKGSPQVSTDGLEVEVPLRGLIPGVYQLEVVNRHIPGNEHPPLRALEGNPITGGKRIFSFPLRQLGEHVEFPEFLAREALEEEIAKRGSASLVHISTTLSIGLLIFGGVVLILEFLIVYRGGDEWNEQNFKVIVTSLVVIMGVFLVVAGFSHEQITPIVGLLGAIVGYVLGRDSSQKQSGPPAASEPANEARDTP